MAGAFSTAYSSAFAGEEIGVAIGVSATSGIGGVSVVTHAEFSVTGLGATSGLGTTTDTQGISTAVTGVSATGQAGETQWPDVDVSLEGLSATGAVGLAHTKHDVATVTDVVRMVGFVGSPSIIAEANVSPTGVSATASFKPVLVWGPVGPNQDPTWTEIAA